MDESYIKKYRKNFVRIIRASPWLAAIVLIAFSVLILASFEGRDPSFKWLAVSKATYMAVAGSLLASALFWILHHVINSLEQARDSVPSEYFEKIHNEWGLVEIFGQRGEQDAQKLYKTLIAKSTKRIWAIGMTNGSCIDQHLVLILERCRKVPDIDVKLVYWDPDTKITVCQQPPVAIMEIQARLESKSATSTDWESKMDAHFKFVTSSILDAGPLWSDIGIYKLSLVTNISCFIIDNHVFFFPFLARSASNLDPHMHFYSEKGIGELIAKHYASILGNRELCCEYSYKDVEASKDVEAPDA